VIQWLSIKTSWVFRGGLPGKKARKRTNSGTEGTNQRRILSKKQKTKKKRNRLQQQLQQKTYPSGILPESPKGF